MLIAAGSDFRGGEVDGLRQANTDLAPTILRILGSNRHRKWMAEFYLKRWSM